jgi:hypothetical protein
MKPEKAEDQLENLKMDDEQLKNMLDRFQPRPSQRFYQRIEGAPWRKPNSRWVGLTPLRVPALVVLATLIAVVVIFATPAGRVLAQRIANFFLPSSSDQVTIEVPVDVLTTPDAGYPLTVDEAETQLGFGVRQPVQLPAGYVFDGAKTVPDRQAVVLNYHYKPAGPTLRLTQRRLGQDFQSIGDSATVELVQIGKTTGEYVTGAWKVPEVKSAFATAHPEATIAVEANWDPDADIQFLRWRDGDMLYEILFAGGKPDQPGYLDKDALIDLAEGLMEE